MGYEGGTMSLDYGSDVAVAIVGQSVVQVNRAVLDFGEPTAYKEDPMTMNHTTPLPLYFWGI